MSRVMIYIMRVPNYFWTKTGYNKYMCKIIQANNVRYDIQDIINALSGLPEENGEKRVYNNRYNYNNIYYCVRISVVMNALKPASFSFFIIASAFDLILKAPTCTLYSPPI